MFDIDFNISNNIRYNFIESLKREIKHASYPPNYKEDKLFYERHISEFNCYAYAMQYKILRCDVNRLLGEDIYPFIPGLFTKSDYKWYKVGDNLMEYFISDLEALNIEYKETFLYGDILEDEYRVCALSSKDKRVRNGIEYKDFHFIRCDKDSLYSEKLCSDGRVIKTNFEALLDYYNIEGILKLKRK